MSRDRPGSDCYDLAFQAGYPIGESAEVALEDYAREMSRSREAEVIRDAVNPSVISGVHVCGLGAPFTRVMITDVEDFARALVFHEGGGLGWS